jgi:translation initiation factor 1
MCPGCGKPVGSCVCKQAVPPASDGIVRVTLETKGRKGQGVTVIRGVPLGADEMATLCKQLKQRCGSGGTIKEGAIEVQGDHRPVVLETLKQRGWKVKT